MTALSDEVAAPPEVLSPPTTAARQPNRVRRIAMRPRRVIVRVHRWLSFVLMAWLIVIGITGAWLVVHDAVESWIHSDRYTESPGDVGLQAAVDTVRAQVPDGSEVYYAQTRRNSRGVYQVGVSVPTDPDAVVPEGEEAPVRYLNYFVDPGTGQINGVMDEEAGATNWLYRGHMYLWQDHGVFGVFAAGGWCTTTTGSEPGGGRGVLCDVIPDGEDMVAWFAVGWIVVLTTGFYLWYWPGVRRWATALVIKRTRGPFAFNMSVHKVVGLIVWMPLTAIAVTGVAFAFPNMERWYDNATPAQRDFYLWTPPESANTSGEADGRTALTIDQVLDEVAETYPSRAVDGLTPPSDDTGTYMLWATRGFSPWTREGSMGNAYMVVDQYSGEVLYDGVPGEGNVFDQAWDDYSFPVHTGDVLGAPTRILWVMFGLSPLVLMVTGVSMNVIRHKKRKRARAAAQETHVAASA